MKFKEKMFCALSTLLFAVTLSSCTIKGPEFDPDYTPPPLTPLSEIDENDSKYAPQMDITQNDQRVIGNDVFTRLMAKKCYNKSYASNERKTSLGTNKNDSGNHVFIGGIQSFNAANTVCPLYYRILTSSSAQYNCLLAEPQAHKDKVNNDHPEEIVAGIVYPYDPQNNASQGYLRDRDYRPIGLTGIFEMDKGEINKWKRVKFEHLWDYFVVQPDAVVIANIVQIGGGNKPVKNVNIRIKDVSESGFHVKVEPWYFDNADTSILEIHYMVINPGTYNMGWDKKRRYDNYIMEVGKVEINQSFDMTVSKKVSLQTDFTGGPPFIATTVQTCNDSQPVVSRISDIRIDNNHANKDSFTLRLQEDYNNYQPDHEYEVVGYIALGAQNGPSTATKDYETVADKYGWLRISRGRFMGVKGHPAQLKGMSGFWPNWEDGGSLVNSSVIDWLVDKWGVTVYRLPVGVDPKDPKLRTGKRMDTSGYIYNRDKRYARICQIINYCIYKGIYIIVDWHIHDGLNKVEFEDNEEKSKYYPEGTKYEEIAKELFGALAKKYRDVPNVIFEIWNEPSKFGHVQDNPVNPGKSNPVIPWDWTDGDLNNENYRLDKMGLGPEDDLKGYSERLIETIRENEKDDQGNPKSYYTSHIIIAPSPCWDQWVDSVELIEDQYPNVEFHDKENKVINTKIAYSFHFYAGSHVPSQAGIELTTKTSPAAHAGVDTGFDRPSIILSEITQDDISYMFDKLPAEVYESVPNPRQAMLLWQWTTEPFNRFCQTTFTNKTFRKCVFVTEWGTTTYDGGGRFPGDLDEEAIGVTVGKDGYLYEDGVIIYDSVLGRNLKPEDVNKWRLKPYTESALIWLKYLEDYRIGWCNWSVSYRDEGASMLKYKVPQDNTDKPIHPNIYGGWLSSELTDSGKFMQDVLTGKYSGYGISRADKWKE